MSHEETRFRIVMVDPVPARFRPFFFGQLPGPEFTFVCPDSDDEHEVHTLVVEADALVTRRRFIDRALMTAAGARLRAIQIQGRVPDRVDLEAARFAGIPVAVMPSKGCIAVAEHAMALMLAVARRIIPGHLGVVGGRYREFGLTPARTTEHEFAFNWLKFPDVTELNGKTLGIVGFGEIGREVGIRARAFDMTVVYFDQRPLPERFERQLGVRAAASLDDLLAESDYVTLHAPHTPENERMIDARRLSLMKPAACLINAARGGLIDEAALVNALGAGRLRAAGLDVFVDEPLPADHPLLALPNVVLAPHVAGGSGGGQRLHAKETLENVARALRGERPQHCVEETVPAAW